jgi:antitoxin component YwqK of YwqJK toxin-antitoxin module
MKRIVTMLLFFISGSVSAQKYQDYGLDKVRIVEPDKIIQAEIIPVTTEPGIKSDRFYYWYSSNKIHYSQGGFSGKLLNGAYNEYYLNKNLKEQGNFKKGLKKGTWKSWNEDGTLSQISVWKNGVIVQKSSNLFWKRVNIFKRKLKQKTVDTLNKTSK